jgi:hypothetical protein
MFIDGKHQVGPNIPGSAAVYCGQFKGLGGRPAGRWQRREHDQNVMQMNEARRCASGPVQWAPISIIAMIDKPGHSDRSAS